MTPNVAKTIVYCCGMCDKVVETPNQAYRCNNCGRSDDLFVIYQEDDPPSITIMFSSVDWHGG
ncbi:MAG: hypothetical protein SFY67_08270 [Candidatus Melainabacteria bacterium]|nr:hypothetical protein [Candidatus Melainabacteria bacterium]